MAPRFRAAREGEALLVAALTIQAARAQGRTVPDGFMDRFADSWREHHRQHPTWLCEMDGEHAGYLLAARIRHLPFPGQTTIGELHEQRLFVRPDFVDRGVAPGLRAAAAAWAASRGVVWVPAH